MSDSERVASRVIPITAEELEQVLRQVQPPDLTGSSRAILRAAAKAVVQGGTAVDVATLLQMRPRTLSRAALRASLPSAVEMMRWFRVILAARELDRPGVTLERAAAACGYASRTVISQVIRDLTGMKPADLVSRGAFATASSLFRGHLMNLRAERRRTRSEHRR